MLSVEPGAGFFSMGAIVMGCHYHGVPLSWGAIVMNIKRILKKTSKWLLIGGSALLLFAVLLFGLIQTGLGKETIRANGRTVISTILTAPVNSASGRSRKRTRW